MDPERQRIQDDLRGRIQGEVHCDDAYLQMYASDASIYEVAPQGVVRPRGASDVVACLQYAAENGISIHARGAGTGLAGGCLGSGIVLDFSHSMRRILATDSETVCVQPGVVLAQLNQHLRERHRQFGPDPAGAEVGTMGSVLAVNRGGSHWLRYGSARDHVVGLQIALADGTLLNVGQHRPGESSDTTLSQLVARLSQLIDANRDTIAAAAPKSLVNSCGFQLHDVWQDGVLDLARLLVGSEGTLAVITEATVRTQPRPGAVGVALLFFDRIDKAAAAAQEMRRLSVSACDLMDRRLLSLARDYDVRFDLLLPTAAEAMLFVEVQDDRVDAVRGRLSQITQWAIRRRKLAFDSRLALDAADVELFWSLTRRIVPSLSRLTGSQRPIPFVEDIAVPPEALPKFLVDAQNIFKRHHVTASFFGHAGHGQLHMRPFLDLAEPEDVLRMQRVATELYDEVSSVGGTISGENGDGLSRSWYVRRHVGALFHVLREVKRTFDPENLLNPGKVASDSPQALTANLRQVTLPRTVNDAPPESSSVLKRRTAGATRETVELQLTWNVADTLAVTRSCNGCGVCRTHSDVFRMCPIFRLEPREEASPRAKANIMRGLLTRELSPADLATDQIKQIADLCVNCHQCREECPAGVDIPKLMVECKGQYVAMNGLPFSDWLLARADLLATAAGRFRGIVNYALARPHLRWVIEKVTGIAQNRKLPRLAARTFLSRARKRRLTRATRSGGQKVLFFTDIYANWFDVQLAEAVVAVFEHNGVSVFVHPRQAPAGMALVSLGALEKARRLAVRNLTILADAVRQGYQVVTAEPSAALCLIHEYQNLVADDDARLVAEHTSEACTYLWRMHQRGQLELDLRPINTTVGYHLPCHLRALGVGAPGENLLKLIPGLNVRRIDHGCSGMAGTYGLKRENYRSSLRAGWELIRGVRDPGLHAATTECSACKIQMEQGTTKPTIHPLKIMALAYGLMPDVAALFTQRGEELIVT